MTEEEKKSFEGFAIVEMFGHQECAGYISSEEIAGQLFVRVDVPGTARGKAWTKFFHPNAIYAITPVDEKAALIAAINQNYRPVSIWTVPVPDEEEDLPF